MGGKNDTEGVVEIQEDEDRKKRYTVEGREWEMEERERQTKFRCVESDVY